MPAVEVVDEIVEVVAPEEVVAVVVENSAGLAAALNDVARRTANIVGYIGEWHSHPSFTSAYPSGFDRALLESLAKTLALEGQPALMIIVGSGGEISIAVKEG